MTQCAVCGDVDVCGECWGNGWMTAGRDRKQVKCARCDGTGHHFHARRERNGARRLIIDRTRERICYHAGIGEDQATPQRAARIISKTGWRAWFGHRDAVIIKAYPRIPLESDPLDVRTNTSFRDNEQNAARRKHLREVVELP